MLLLPSLSHKNKLQNNFSYKQIAILSTPIHLSLFQRGKSYGWHRHRRSELFVLARSSFENQKRRLSRLLPMASWAELCEAAQAKPLHSILSSIYGVGATLVRESNIVFTEPLRGRTSRPTSRSPASALARSLTGWHCGVGAG